MVKLELTAEPRQSGKKGDLKHARQEKKIPAVLYGFKQDNQQIWLDYPQAEKVYQQAGSYTLINLKREGQEDIKVIAREAQLNPVSDKIIHMDLYRPDLSKPIEVEIPIHFQGDAPAQKSLGGTLVTGLNTLHIRCLPENLIHEVKVDVSSIETFEDSIHVADLDLPDNIELLTEEDHVVASATPPRLEEEPLTPEAEEGEEGEAAEGEEGEEGEAAEGEEGEEGEAGDADKEKSGAPGEGA